MILYLKQMYQASEDLLREHYWDLRHKPFFGDLISYMSSGPVVAMVRFFCTCGHTMLQTSRNPHDILLRRVNVLRVVHVFISLFVQVWEGLDVVKTARKMLGETNPVDSLPGTIRGDCCVEVGR